MRACFGPPGQCEGVVHEGWQDHVAQGGPGHLDEVHPTASPHESKQTKDPDSHVLYKTLATFLRPLTGLEAQ